MNVTCAIVIDNTVQGTIRNQRIQDGTGGPSGSTRIRTRTGPYPWVPQVLGTYGSSGYGPVRVRVLRVQPGRDTGPTGTEPGGGHANGICAETRPMGDTRGPGSRAHGKPARRGAVGGRPGPGSGGHAHVHAHKVACTMRHGTCACACA